MLAKNPSTKAFWGTFPPRNENSDNAEGETAPEPRAFVAVDPASYLPAPQLDAAKVLALALTAALEGENAADFVSGSSIKLRDEVARFEANLIKSALTFTGGRQRRAARLLGINVASLNSRIKRYKLNLKSL